MNKLIELKGCIGGGDLWVIVSDHEESLWISVGAGKGMDRSRTALALSWVDALRLAETIVKADKERGCPTPPASPRFHDGYYAMSLKAQEAFSNLLAEAYRLGVAEERADKPLPDNPTVASVRNSAFKEAAQIARDWARGYADLARVADLIEARIAQ